MIDYSKIFYYMDQNGGKVGPVELTEIKNKVERKELGEDVLIHQKGGGCWIAYKQYLKINLASLCMEEHCSPTLPAIKFCDTIAWFLLVCCVVFTLICLPGIELFPLMWGVTFFLLWKMVKTWIKAMSAVTGKRDRRIIEAIDRISQTDKTAQMIIELQQKRIEELEKQLNCSTDGK